MAQISTTITKVYFDIEPEFTVANIYVVSTAPDDPFFGTGWRRKKFAKSLTIWEILLNLQNLDFIGWERKTELPFSVN